MNRALDLAGAAIGLAVASPFFGAAALAIKLDDGGPVLYRQRRVGKDGREFELLKLRTMIVGAEGQGAGWAVNRGRSADHSRRPGAPAALARRAAAALERACGAR